MWVFILWFIFALLVGAMAAGKGRNAFLAFLLAVILSPLVGFIIVAVLKDKKREQIEAARHAELVAVAKPVAANDTRACPRCAETIKRAAVACRFCGAEVGSAA